MLKITSKIETVINGFDESAIYDKVDITNAH